MNYSICNMYTPEQNRNRKKKKITSIRLHAYININIYKKMKNEYKYIILHILSIPVCPRSYPFFS